MKEYSKDKILQALKEMTDSQQQAFTAEEIAAYLGLSRSVTSNYLSQLLKAKRVKKSHTRPVYWQLPQDELAFPAEEVFTGFVGHNGSHRAEIRKCIEAVNYPPNGLPIIIFGNSGVGKSFLSELVYHYAKREQIISADSEFVVLNCANYANNPELLSSVLFGYEQGAFTGASEAKNGMLKRADGGFLFLDEVHRLSEENQEKLFTFMDTGRFSKLGSNSDCEVSKTRLIFATTESAESQFLTTFLRRIPVKIYLKDYENRPTHEKFALIENLLISESEKIGKEILMKNDVIAQLCNVSFAGNIGALKNIIKLCCAEAFTNQKTLDLVIDDDILKKKIRYRKKDRHRYPSIYTRERASVVFTQKVATEVYQQICLLNEEMVSERQVKDFLLECFYFQKITFEAFDDYEYQEFVVAWQDFFEICYGLKFEKQIINIIYYFSLQLQASTTEVTTQTNKIYLKQRAYYLAEQFLSGFNHLSPLNKEVLTMIIVLFIQKHIAETPPIFGLLVAHGSSTASSIRNLVNNLCQTFVFEAFDMPFETTSQEISQKVIDYISRFEMNQKLVLMVDMGSLNQLYTSISNWTNGDVLVIDNLSTTTALDMGLKISSATAFDEIIKTVTQEYKINVKYYEGISYKENIVISCLSGLGISEKIAEIFQKFIDPEVELIVLDYLDLRKRLAENPKDFSDSIAVFSTVNIDSQNIDKNTRWINIYEIFDEGFSQQLYEILRDYLSYEEYEKLADELFRLFSFEGIGERLVFLKPEVVFGEVEKVIHQYEMRYSVSFEHKVKLNFYMHLAFMIERLLTDKDGKKGLMYQADEHFEAFRKISQPIFKEVEAKFNISVNEKELQMLYELMKTFIN